MNTMEEFLISKFTQIYFDCTKIKIKVKIQS